MFGGNWIEAKRKPSIPTRNQFLGSRMPIYRCLPKAFFPPGAFSHARCFWELPLPSKGVVFGSPSCTPVYLCLPETRFSEPDTFFFGVRGGGEEGIGQPFASKPRCTLLDERPSLLPFAIPPPNNLPSLPKTMFCLWEPFLRAPSLPLESTVLGNPPPKGLAMNLNGKPSPKWSVDMNPRLNHVNRRVREEPAYNEFCQQRFYPRRISVPVSLGERS